MSPRSIRRAAERKANKIARKQAKQEVTFPGPTPTPEAGPTPTPTRNRSTGPWTPEGKAISRLNNTSSRAVAVPIVPAQERHALTGNFRLLQSESQEVFAELRDAFRAEHGPCTATEFLLVDRLAEHVWLSQRAQRFQNQAAQDGDNAWFALMLRYETTHDRAFHKCLAELRTIRREKKRNLPNQVSEEHVSAPQATQFESQNPKRAASATKTESPSALKTATAPVSALDSGISPASDASSNGKTEQRDGKTPAPTGSPREGNSLPMVIL